MVEIDMNFIGDVPYVMGSFLILFLLFFYKIYNMRVIFITLTAVRRELLHNFSHLRFIVKILSSGFAIIALMIALMRPASHQGSSQAMRQGRDIIIAIDISRSMGATDCMPSRLLHAITTIKKFIYKTPDTRVGLLLFSGTALMQCPLTYDLATFNLFLDGVNTEMSSSGTTCLGAALDTMADYFSHHMMTRNKLILLFTDGEDFSGSLDSAKKKLQELNVHICIVGTGTPEGAPVPVFNADGVQTGFQTDATGITVISRLNERLLQAIARECSGLYIRVSDNYKDVDALVHYFNQFEQEQCEDALVVFDEKYYYAAGSALLLLMIEWLL